MNNNKKFLKRSVAAFLAALNIFNFAGGSSKAIILEEFIESIDTIINNDGTGITYNTLCILQDIVLLLKNNISNESVSKTTKYKFGELNEITIFKGQRNEQVIKHLIIDNIDNTNDMNLEFQRNNIHTAHVVIYTLRNDALYKQEEVIKFINAVCSNTLFISEDDLKTISNGELKLKENKLGTKELETAYYYFRCISESRHTAVTIKKLKSADDKIENLNDKIENLNDKIENLNYYIKRQQKVILKKIINALEQNKDKLIADPGMKLTINYDGKDIEFRLFYDKNDCDKDLLFNLELEYYEGCVKKTFKISDLYGGYLKNWSVEETRRDFRGEKYSAALFADIKGYIEHIIKNVFNKIIEQLAPYDEFNDFESINNHFTENCDVFETEKLEKESENIKKANSRAKNLEFVAGLGWSGTLVSLGYIFQNELRNACSTVYEKVSELKNSILD